jgi:hypothetical protein
MKIKFGTRWENVCQRRGVLEIYPEWRDLWVGVFVGPDAVYVCLLPCMVLRFSRGSTQDPMSYMREAMEKAFFTGNYFIDVPADWKPPKDDRS